MQWGGFKVVGSLLPFALLLAACSTTSAPEKSAPGVSGNYKVGKPYQINGRWYYPKEDPTYDMTGIASWYGPDFHGKMTANGEIYDMNALTAAHTTLPMPSYVRVTNLENGRALILRVNDRGPFAKSRVIDVSRRAAQLLGFHGQGTAKVRVQVVAPDTSAEVAAEAKVVPIAAGPAIIAVPTERVDVSTVDSAELDPPPASNYAGAAMPAGPVEMMAPPTHAVHLKPSNKVYVQAGAFSAIENARRLADTLKSLAVVELSPTTQAGGMALYRVRLGPLDTMDQADAVLSQVVAKGHGNARIVVD